MNLYTFIKENRDMIKDINLDINKQDKQLEIKLKNDLEYEINIENIEKNLDSLCKKIKNDTINLAITNAIKIVNKKNKTNKQTYNIGEDPITGEKILKIKRSIDLVKDDKTINNIIDKISGIILKLNKEEERILLLYCGTFLSIIERLTQPIFMTLKSKEQVILYTGGYKIIKDIINNLTGKIINENR